jgi:hypothetical protein
VSHSPISPSDIICGLLVLRPLVRAELEIHIASWHDKALAQNSYGDEIESPRHLRKHTRMSAP